MRKASENQPLAGTRRTKGDIVALNNPINQDIARRLWYELTKQSKVTRRRL
jgi:hypothetical protein